MTLHVSPRDAGPGDEARVPAGHRDEEGAGGAGQPLQRGDRPGQTLLVRNHAWLGAPGAATQILSSEYSRKVFRESTFESTWEERI